MTQGPFDFIVVGAGSAGCALAARLAESGVHRVLLLEAGPRDTNPWIHVPIGYGKLFNHPVLNWRYATEPEPALDGRRIPQPRGRVLGGCSSINGLVYMRGDRADFDGWRDAGNPGWGYDDVLPHFRHAERQARGADSYHGGDGPLDVSDATEPHPLVDAFVDAGVNAGFNRNPDFNGHSSAGFGYYQTTMRNGLRRSSARAYLGMRARDGGLVVRTGAHVHRVLFDGTRAVGVEWEEHGARRQTRAAREIVLAAGAFDTPKLLELSGIGAGQRLASLGVPIVVDRPAVGENLQDHLQVRCVLRCTRPVTLNDDLGSPWRAVRLGLRFLLQRRGLLTVSAGYGGAFVHPTAPSQRPTHQVYLIPFSTQRMGDRLHPFSGFTLSACQLRPESRGDVHAASPNALDPPRIRCNFLSTPNDVSAALQGLRFVRALAARQPLAAWVDAEIEPGPELTDDAALLDFIRSRASTLYHACGTARMGSDADAVVDPALRVRGVSGLRIADCSIMPTLVSGNTNAAAIMIGEKAASLVLERDRS